MQMPCLLVLVESNTAIILLKVMSSEHRYFGMRMSDLMKINTNSTQMAHIPKRQLPPMQK